MMEVYVIIPIATMAIMAMAEGIIAIREIMKIERRISLLEKQLVATTRELGRLLFEHINNK